MRWEEGQIKTITISATAGNVTTDETPGATKKWKILYAYFSLVTDATVADRTFNIYITDSSNNPLTGNVYSAAHVASTTKYYNISPWNISGTNFTVAGNSVTYGMRELIISGTDKMRIGISNGVAGDSYSGRIKVIELPA